MNYTKKEMRPPKKQPPAEKKFETLAGKKLRLGGKMITVGPKLVRTTSGASIQETMAAIDKLAEMDIFPASLILRDE